MSLQRMGRQERKPPYILIAIIVVLLIGVVAAFMLSGDSHSNKKADAKSGDKDSSSASGTELEVLPSSQETNEDGDDKSSPTNQVSDDNNTNTQPGTYCGDGSCDSNEDCDSCMADCGCSGGEVCCSGNCEECCSDSDCDHDEVCDGNECEPDVECTSDSDCDDDEVCCDNECEEPECFMDSDCDDDQDSCVSYYCDNAGECDAECEYDDSDCDEEDVCDGGSEPASDCTPKELYDALTLSGYDIRYTERSEEQYGSYWNYALAVIQIEGIPQEGNVNLHIGSDIMNEIKDVFEEVCEDSEVWIIKVFTDCGEKHISCAYSIPSLNIGGCSLGSNLPECYCESQGDRLELDYSIDDYYISRVTERATYKAPYYCSGDDYMFSVKLKNKGDLVPISTGKMRLESYVDDEYTSWAMVPELNPGDSEWISMQRWDFGMPEEGIWHATDGIYDIHFYLNYFGEFTSGLEDSNDNNNQISVDVGIDACPRCAELDEIRSNPYTWVKGAGYFHDYGPENCGSCRSPSPVEGGTNFTFEITADNLEGPQDELRFAVYEGDFDDLDDDLDIGSYDVICEWQESGDCIWEVPDEEGVVDIYVVVKNADSFHCTSHSDTGDDWARIRLEIV